jgi:transcriptional regulator with XRE-family HTH domain
MQDDKILLGKKFKEIRAKRKITQESFSEMIGLEPSSLSNIETGKSFPSMQTILNLIKEFNIEPQELFNYTYLSDDKILESEIIEIIKRQSSDKKQILYRIIKAFDI